MAKQEVNDLGNISEEGKKGITMKRIVRALFGISFIFYLLGLVYFIFLKSGIGNWEGSSLYEYIKNTSNIIPFKTIGFYVGEIVGGYTHVNPDIPIKNLLGNLIIFMPMGIYLPFFIKKVDKATAFFLIMTALLFSIELTQLITRSGRFDIDDYILNIIGGFIGFVIWKTKAVQSILKK